MASIKRKKTLPSMTFSRRTKALTACSLFLAALTSPYAALANGGERFQAFQQFQQNNPDLAGKELKMQFRDQWKSISGGNNGIPGAIHHNAEIQNLIAPVHSGLGAGTDNVSNQLSKLEIKAARQALKLEHNGLGNIDNFRTIQDVGSKVVGANNLSIDLGSALENITLGSNLFRDAGSVTITVGSESKTLSAGSKVTAAEYVAAKQVLNAGGQKVTIDASRTAIGGSVDLSALTSGNKSMRIDDLKITEGVTAYGDFGKGGDVRITGDLVNNGGIVAYSSQKNVDVANVRADNIVNNAGANIRTGLNAELGGVVDNVSLGLYANNNLSNYGSINSAGDLTLSAGGNLSNSGTVVAQNNVNLQAPDVSNSGSIASVASNINLDSSIASVLNVNNAAGTLTALDGAINIRGSHFDEAFDTNITGGDLFSKEVNINSGRGLATVDVGELTGIVRSKGEAVHVAASTNVLQLGAQCLTGDPTYYNTFGDIVLSENIDVNENLAILASGSIIGGAGLSLISARGFNIIMVAGAETNHYEISSGISTYVNPNLGNGGNIDFSVASPSLTITSAGGLGTGNSGGNITMVAFPDAATRSTKGQIILPASSTINTSADGMTAGAGDINLIAGATTTTPITVGNIVATGNNSPKVNLFAAQPTSSDGEAVSFNAFGQITSGTTFIPAAMSQTLVGTPGGVVLGGNIVTSGGDFAIISNGSIDLTGATINLSAYGNAGNLTLLAGFNFSSANGDFGDPLIYSNFTPSSLGGSIIGGADIFLRSNRSQGGNLIAMASKGSITLGEVETSGYFGGNSGEVVIVGEGGVTVRKVWASTNDVTIVSAAPVLSSDFKIQGGSVISGSPSYGALSSGVITVGSVDAQNGGVLTIRSKGDVFLNRNFSNGVKATHFNLEANILDFDYATEFETYGGSIRIVANAITSKNGVLSFEARPEAAFVGAGIDVTLNAQEIATTPTDLNFRAVHIGSNSGSTIKYTSNSNLTTVIGTGHEPAKGTFQRVTFDAQSFPVRGGDGGTVEVAVGGNLIVNTSGIKAGPLMPTGDFDGGHYDLRAGTGTKGGTLQVFGHLTANGVGSGNGGTITLTSASKTAFDVNSGKALANGLQGVLTANGAGSQISIINERGGISISDAALLNSDTLTLQTGAKGTILSGAGQSITAKNLNLTAVTGNIGGKAPLLIDTEFLNVSTEGSVSILNTSSDALSVTNAHGGKGFKLETASGVSIDQITTTKGSVSVISSGDLVVNGGGVITANNGALTLQNKLVNFGSIVISDNAKVETQGKGGQTTLAIGAIPKKGTNPVTPGNEPDGFAIETVGKGTVFFGSGAVTSSGLATIKAINKNVLLSNQSTIPGSEISLGNNSLVIADPPSPVTSSQEVSAISSNLTDAGPKHANRIGSTSELFAFDSDYSKVWFLASGNVQASATNANLLTFSKANFLQTLPASANNSYNDDDSYVVGRNASIAETEASICSDLGFVHDLSGKGQALPGVALVSHAQRMVFNNGNVLLAPQVDTVVETQHGNVTVAGKSVVLISATNAGLAVFDFDDQHKGSVSVEANGHHVVLSPGRHVMVTPHLHAEFAQINAVETVAHRNIASTTKGGSRTHVSEFSIPSAMDSVKPLKAMVMSNHPDAKRVAARMLKTTAVVMQLGGGQDEYQHYFKPRMTAMAK